METREQLIEEQHMLESEISSLEEEAEELQIRLNVIYSKLDALSEDGQ